MVVAVATGVAMAMTGAVGTAIAERTVVPMAAYPMPMSESAPVRVPVPILAAGCPAIGALRARPRRAWSDMRAGVAIGTASASIRLVWRRL